MMALRTCPTPGLDHSYHLKHVAHVPPPVPLHHDSSQRAREHSYSVAQKRTLRPEKISLESAKSAYKALPPELKKEHAYVKVDEQKSQKSSRMARYLIVTADDFGYCKERNRGIVDAFRRKVITRSSLLINGSAAKHAAQLASENCIPLGLHFNVTEGLPVADTDCVSSLLTDNGVFKGKAGFREAVFQDKINLDEMRLELEAQLALFKDMTGYTPLYVDGHNHIHVLPGVSEVFARVLGNNSIGSVRLPNEVALNHAKSWLQPAQRMAFYMDVVKESTVAAKSFYNDGIRFSDGFIGMATMGKDMTVDRLENLLFETFKELEANTKPTGQNRPNMDLNNSTHCDMHTPGHNEDASVTCDANRIGPDSRTPEVSVHSAPRLVGDRTPVELPVSDNTQCDIDPIRRVEEANQVQLPENGNNNSTYNINTSNSKVVELMVHPGYPCVDMNGGCGVGPDDFARSRDREHELNVLSSDLYRTMCERNRLQLCAQLPTCMAG